MTNKSKPVLRLYVRADCHLCEVMKRELLAVKDDYGFEFEIHDLDARPGDMQRYSDHVPVLLWGQDVVCYHALDKKRLAGVLGVSPAADGKNS